MARVQTALRRFRFSIVVILNMPIWTELRVIPAVKKAKRPLLVVFIRLHESPKYPVYMKTYSPIQTHQWGFTPPVWLKG